jgi:transposase-like protein
MENHTTSPKFSAEVRERAVRMVFAHRTEHTSQWVAIASIAAKIGCTAQTLSNWVRQAERDQGKRPGTTTGSTTAGFSHPSATCCRPKQKPPTMPPRAEPPLTA